jgi:hypothetical protein
MQVAAAATVESLAAIVRALRIQSKTTQARRRSWLSEHERAWRLLTVSLSL